MKISELIQLLESIKETDGDLGIYIKKPHYDDWNYEGLEKDDIDIYENEGWIMDDDQKAIGIRPAF